MRGARWFGGLAGGLAGALLGMVATAGAQLMPIPLGPAPPRVAGVARHPGTGLVTFLAAPAAGALAAGEQLGPGAPADLAARAWVGANAPLFGLDAPGAAVETIRAEARPGGGSLVRLRQTHRGVPVFGGQLNVALDAGRRVLWVAAETVRPGDLGVTPALDAAAARAAALAATAAKYELDAAALAAGDAHLEVYDPVVFDPTRHAPSLVWRLEVTAGVRPLRELVLVDASSGAVRLAFNQIDTARDRLTYTMGGSDDETLLPGTFLCNESDPDCVGGDADARDAHVFAGDTYDYFLATLGRDGIDGAGMPIVSSVHFGVGFENAFWNGSQMVYGDGYSQADDVVGHELAHGVTDYTSGLFYWAESGAINESYSDLHGELTDLANGVDDPGDRWYLGEDLPTGAIRNLANPPELGDPDRIGSPSYYEGLFDNAGVHGNSGVSNKAITLMADGGIFNGQEITSIEDLPGATAKTAWLYYVVQRDYLTPASNFVDLAAYLRAACTALAAAADHGFDAGDCVEVNKALVAVEMDQLPGQRFVNADDPTITTKGVWTTFRSSFALYETYRQSRRIGNLMRIPFTGNRVTVFYLPVKGGGVLEVYLDSLRRKVGQIDQSRGFRPNAYALELNNLPAGPHTLILRHASGTKVTFDALAYREAATELPADGVTGWNNYWYWYAANVEFMNYKGLWNVWPSYLSESWRRRDQVSYTFTGNATRIFFYADPALPFLGTMKVFLDGILLGAVNQRLPPGGAGIYYVELAGFPRGTHTVLLKHGAGQLITLDGIGAYDLTLP